jgi:dephospho-CoA kinase
MPLIGLTGGIATGKSLVADYLRRKGIHIVDADQLAHEVVRQGEPAWQEVVDAFGREFLLPDGGLDREALGRLIFSVPEQRKKLEGIIHPRVFEAAEKMLRPLLTTDPERVVVFSVPLLFESGFAKQVDRIVVVYADEATQTQRLMQRNGLTKEEALQRIHSQMPMDEKIKRADFVIDNTSTPEAVYRQVDALLEQFLS